MKKFALLYFLLTTVLCVKAQMYDTGNYQLLWEDQFTGNRSWNTNTFIEQSNEPGFVLRWECKLSEYWPYYVTTDPQCAHQAYQPNNARFGMDNKMRLVAEWKSLIPLECDDPLGYILPAGALCSTTYNGTFYPPHNKVFYHSGMIETIDNSNWYGYYEIKCQLPVHDGESAAFWLYGHGPSTYEEIDIFEHSQGDSHATGNMATDFSCGIWYNPDGTNYKPDTLHPEIRAHNYFKRYVEVAENNDLTNEHVFGLEWLPDRITWFFDGNVVNDCAIPDSIPQHQMNLRVTHPVDNGAIETSFNLFPKWHGSDEFVIDYIKVYKLISDCETDLYIQSANDFVNYDYGVKHSITIDSSNGITVPSNTNLIMRAEDSITITNNGGFTVPLGVDLTLMVHSCVDY